VSILVLKNPKTESYLLTKEKILSSEFAWVWRHQSTNHTEYDVSKYSNVPYYSHCFLTAPTKLKIPVITCEHTYAVSNVLLEILQENNISINSFIRINANCVHPLENVVSTVPHVDHKFQHKNIIVYLTDAGGKTFVGNDAHDPCEDDVIVFDGLEEHYLQTPKDKRRIVIVATFI
jgi:hypothetical protein